MITHMYVLQFDNLKWRILTCFSALTCWGGLIPTPPEGGVAELIKRGYEYGPCLGTSTMEHEVIPSCPEVSVLIMDDSISTLGLVRTIVQLKTEFDQDLVIDLRFSKDVFAEEVGVNSIFFFFWKVHKRVVNVNLHLLFSDGLTWSNH